MGNQILGRSLWDGLSGSAPSPAVSAVPASIPSAGDVFRVRYPFVREPVTLFSEDGPYDTISWRPGVNVELCGPYGDADIVANGEGEMVLTVVDVHKPGRFPTRVFFTRKFVSPDGHVFGKGCLRITTLDAFRRRAAGYSLKYDVEDMRAAQAIEARRAATTGAVEDESAVPQGCANPGADL